MKVITRITELWENRTYQHMVHASQMRSDVQDEIEIIDCDYFRTWLLSLSALASSCDEPEALLPLLTTQAPYTGLDARSLLKSMIEFGERINPFDSNGEIADKGLWIIVTALLHHIDVTDPSLCFDKRCYASIAADKGTLFIMDKFLSIKGSVLDQDTLNTMLLMDTQTSADKYVDEVVALYLSYGADLQAICPVAEREIQYADFNTISRYYLQAALLYDQWPQTRQCMYYEGVKVLVRARFGCTPLQCLKRLDENDAQWLPMLIQFYLHHKNITPLDYLNRKGIPDFHRSGVVGLL